MRTSLVPGLAAALTVLIALQPAGPAAAAPAPTDIVVLGDSYSAGNGAGDYYGPTKCWRSHATWAERYRARLVAAGRPATLTNVACNGATTGAIFLPTRRPDDDGCASAPRAPDEYRDAQCRAWLRPQLDAVTAGTELVLLTLGGNDAGFHQVVVQCFVPGTRDAAGCRGAVAQARAAAVDPGPAGLTARLSAVLTAIHARSPHATVVLFGYPQLIGTGFRYVLAGRPRYDAQAGVRELHARGQAAQRAAVDRANAGGAFAVFGGAVADVFAGHEPDPRLFHPNPRRWLFEALDGIASPEKAYHPNPLGHAAYAGLVQSIVDSGRPALHAAVVSLN